MPFEEGTQNVESAVTSSIPLIFLLISVLGKSGTPGLALVWGSVFQKKRGQRVSGSPREFPPEPPSLWFGVRHCIAGKGDGGIM